MPLNRSPLEIARPSFVSEKVGLWSHQTAAFTLWPDRGGGGSRFGFL